MSQELIYTSAPRGLKPGSKGFCTVAQTAGLSAAWAERLESLSGYRPVYPLGDARSADNPVALAHWRVTVPGGGGPRSVLSRVRFAGADYSGRSNKLARHVVLDPAEQSPAGPAWTLLHDRADAAWSGEARQLPAGPAVPQGDRPPSVATSWARLAGDAGWAAALADAFAADPARPAVLIYPPNLSADQILRLFEESLSLLPARQRWSVTFNTYFTDLPLNLTCAWRGVVAGTAAADAARVERRALVLDLSKLAAPPAPIGRLADAARAGTGPATAAKTAPQARPTTAGSVPAATPDDGVEATGETVSRRLRSAEPYPMVELVEEEDPDGDGPATRYVPRPPPARLSGRKRVALIASAVALVGGVGGLRLTPASPSLVAEAAGPSRLRLSVRRVHGLGTVTAAECGSLWVANGSLYLQWSTGDQTAASDALRTAALQVGDDTGGRRYAFAEPVAVTLPLASGGKPVAVAVAPALATTAKWAAGPLHDGWRVEHPAEADLRRATDLAKRPTERSAVDDWSDQVATVRVRRQQESDRQFTAEGKAVAAMLDQQLSPDAVAADPAGSAKRIETATEAVDELRHRRGISTGLQRAQVAALDATVAQRRQGLASFRSTATLLEQLRRATSVDANESVLQQLVAGMDRAGPRAAGYADALSRTKANRAADDWAVLVGQWSGQMVPATADAAVERAAVVKQYRDGHSDPSPVSAAVAGYDAYLQAGISATSTTGPWNGKLAALLRNPLVHDLRCLQTRAGRRFYVTADARVSPVDGGGEAFDAITSPDLSSPTQLQVEADDPLRSRQSSLSPQAEFARTATVMLGRLSFGNWETFGPRAIDALMAQRDLDPILRAILLQRLIQMDEPTVSWGGGLDAYAPVATAVAGLNVEDVEWLDPRHAAGEAVLTPLKSATDGLPAATTASAALHQRQQRVIQAATFNPVARGVLVRDAGGICRIAGTDDSAGGGSGSQAAWVATADGGWVVVGRRDAGGRWSLASSAGGPLAPEGSLVFVVPAATGH